MKGPLVLRLTGCCIALIGLVLIACGDDDKTTSPNAGASTGVAVPSRDSSSVAATPTAVASSAPVTATRPATSAAVPLDNLCQLFPNTGYLFRPVPPGIGATDGTFRGGCQARSQCETDVSGFCKVNINVTRDDGAMFRKFATAYTAKTATPGLGEEGFLVTNPSGTIILRRGQFSVYATIDGDPNNLKSLLTPVDDAMRNATAPGR